VRVCLAACWLAVLGCGRFSFDDRSDAMETGVLDGSPDAMVAITSYTVTPPTFVTTSTSYVEVPDSRLVVPPSPNQAWLLLVSGSLESSSFDYSAPEARYLVDGVERGRGGTESVEAGHPGPWQHFYLFEGTELPRTITFELRDNLGAATTLERLRAVLVPVPADANPVFEKIDPPTMVTTPAFTPVVQLTLGTTTPGEYLVLLLANTTEAPTTSDVDTQWLDPQGIPWNRSFKNPRGAWQSQLIVRRATLPATVTFQASSGAQSTVEYVRAVGLRIAGLTSFDESTSTAVQMTSVTTPLTVNSLTPQTPASADHYLVFGTLRVDDECGNAQLAARGVDFVVDGIIHTGEHIAGNCAAEMTYGYVGLHDTRPSLLSASISSPHGLGDTVIHDESTLFVVGVP
jgi:hypothetical protein